MTEKRFITGGYKIYDTYKDDEYLVNNVDAQRIVDTMNNLDTKARERSKALSHLQKEKEQLKQEVREYIKALNKTLEEKEELRKENEQFKKKQLSLLHDEFRGYFGLLKHGAKNLSEKAIVEKIQGDINNILQEVFDDD